MKKFLASILVATFFVLAIPISSGPAPNSGDGVPDGPGWSDDYPVGNHGPAPNSGDCVPGGPGW